MSKRTHVFGAVLVVVVEIAIDDVVDAIVEGVEVDGAGVVVGLGSVVVVVVDEVVDEVVDVVVDGSVVVVFVRASRARFSSHSSTVTWPLALGGEMTSMSR